MADESENMVLRTVYLPRELDQKLKAAAIRSERSKGDIIRDLIQAGFVAKESSHARGFITPEAKAPVSVRLVAAKPVAKTAPKSRSAKLLAKAKG